MKQFHATPGGLLLLAVVTATVQAETNQPPTVPISQPVQRDVIDYVTYTGRTAASMSVKIVPRVTGFVTAVHFKEGSHVQKGELLFEIDPRPYEAVYDVVKAEVATSEASFQYAKVTYERLKELSLANKGAISVQELDQHQALMSQALATLALAKAKLQTAKLHLDWTKITSPLEGQIGRTDWTVGNLATKDVTALATVVSVDPVHVYFDMDEATLLRLKCAANEGKIAPLKAGKLSVGIRLVGETGYAHEAVVDFVDNHVDAAKGTIAVRAVLANPKLKNGVALLLPGMFVHVRLQVSQPYAALLVVDRAVWSDQGLKFVYVVGKDNKVEARPVTLGPLQEDGLRAIVAGLKKDDWVVIGGLQLVKPGLQVQPEKVSMPVLKTP